MKGYERKKIYFGKNYFLSFCLQRAVVKKVKSFKKFSKTVFVLKILCVNGFLSFVVISALGIE